MNPQISIITPNYNSSKFIGETIESVINQTFQHWEMIIVDDCSTDDSLSIVEKYVQKDNRIKRISLTKNSGAAVARNKAIEFANGDYIAFLDSDDRWFPKKLEIQLEFMVKRDLAFSFTSYYSVDENKEKKKLLEANKLISYKDLLTNNYIGCLTAMYSIQHLGKVYMPLVNKRQDWALWLKITKDKVDAVGIKEPLAWYTRRENSVSSNKFKLLKYNWRIYRKHEQLSRAKALYYFIQLFYKKLIK